MEKNIIKDFSKTWTRLKIKIYPIYRWFLNLSLYWKVGFIIGSCFFINLFIAFYFYFLLYKTTNLQKQVPYEYELLTTKALIYINQQKTSRNFFTLKENLKKFLPVLDKAIYEYPQLESHIREIRNILSQKTSSYDLNDLKTLEKDFLEINKFFNNRRITFEKRIEKYRKILNYLKYIMFLVMIIFLTWGTWAFYYMVKKPLDRISERLDNLMEEREDFWIEDAQSCIFEYPAQDEIGKLITKVNEIIKNFRTLALFKHTIENDETPDLVYERLGYYLQHILNIDSVIIYEVSNSQNTMRPVYVSREDLDYPSEKLFNANRCRAKRTGQIVTSLEFPDICKIFPFKDEFDYYCIPMMYGGQCIGIIEIHIPKNKSLEEKNQLKEKLRKVKAFIKEAVPVIEAKRYAQTLKEQSFKDALTGLYNRHFLEATLENLVAQVLRRGTTLGILMCDLDYFKSVNDKYGHDAGDIILKETARLLASNVRKSDIVVRFGGEEFLILLVDVKEGESVKIAEKLRKIIETNDFKIPQGVIKRTISIGVSEFPVDTSAIWEAIKYADVALYKAKELGRNRVVRFKKEFWTDENY